MKRLFFGIIFILLILAISHTPQAMVKGVCSDCHTMHNSQMGEEMAYDFSDTTHTFSTTATPKPTLLIYSCVGCHTNVNNDATKVGIVPIVFNPADVPTKPLAGGNFYYVIQDKANGHNVVGITVADSSFTGKKIPGSATDYNGNQVACAGESGCHGDRSAGNDELEAMKTAHHTDDDTGGVTGASIGLSYRFLDGILGTEDDDWEQNDGNTTHNEYKGATSPGTDTISSLCGKCHGDFHSSAGTGSPWLRHPTDYTLPGGTTEYAAYTTYSMTAPVARTSPGTSSNDVGPGTGTAIVMCLSCHRAHGSPNYKMIRWNYKANMDGCIVCHTSKN